jgi:PhoPQ-activated pathogenicity-related protein
MTFLLRIACALLLTAWLSVAAVAQATKTATEQTALDRYVAKPDPAYKYEFVKQDAGDGYTAFVLDMTSQTWRSANEVDRTVWRHWLTIVKPAEVKYSKALLFITGGNNNSTAPARADAQLANIAKMTKSVVAELKMVPNQPLVFSDDKKARTEDAIIAYTWDKYMKTGDDQWPLRLPMTKAAVRAMDTIMAFCASPQAGNGTVDGFVVAGGSKRGWTTWTTAAVDKRVVAIIPIVIDMLNVVPSFKHHRAVYGYYAPAVGDYETMGIMSKEDTPEYKALMKIEEPYEYRQRLTMPKFIINATGDQFFLPDSWQFYFNDLPGVKHLRYVPNAEHSLNGSDAWFTAIACYNSVLTQAALPQYNWEIAKDGTMTVKTKDKPAAVKLWQASNPGARDFRLTTIGPRWKATDLTESKPGEYVAKMAAPKRGFTAYMVELTFPSGLALAPYKFTTGVKVIPDIEPFRDEVNSDR